MFFAMQDALDSAKAEFNKKFEEKVRAEKKFFSFDNDIASTTREEIVVEDDSTNIEETV
jgi:hypothetical protein